MVDTGYHLLNQTRDPSRFEKILRGYESLPNRWELNIRRFNFTDCQLWGAPEQMSRNQGTAIMHCNDYENFKLECNLTHITS